MQIAVLLLPPFNALATFALLDPLRAVNYLRGEPRYIWRLLAPDGQDVVASNGVILSDIAAFDAVRGPFDVVVISASWSPERRVPALRRWLRRHAARGALMSGIDTGAFVLASAGLLDGHRSCVHYEHVASFRELYPDVQVSEQLYVVDAERATCCGGLAASDMALEIVRAREGLDVANAAARYIFHDRLRSGSEGQLPARHEPVGIAAPAKLRQAIACMETYLEAPLPIAEIARRAGLSQRQLSRLFQQHTGITAVRYYLDSRLDRARGLVTQTEMPLLQVALACGFSSQEHFARTYRMRFGLAPSQDRHDGRVPFQFRAYPAHRG